MKKNIIDIYLMNRPVGRQRNRKNNANGSLFENRAEGVRKIMPFMLMEAFGNKMSFVLLKRTICVELPLGDPLAPNKICMRR